MLKIIIKNMMKRKIKKSILNNNVFIALVHHPIKNIKNEIKKLSIKSNKELNHGEIELKVNGITIRKTIR